MLRRLRPPPFKAYGNGYTRARRTGNMGSGYGRGPRTDILAVPLLAHAVASIPVDPSPTDSTAEQLPVVSPLWASDWLHSADVTANYLERRRNRDKWDGRRRGRRRGHPHAGCPYRLPRPRPASPRRHVRRGPGPFLLFHRLDPSRRAGQTTANPLSMAAEPRVTRHHSDLRTTLITARMADLSCNEAIRAAAMQTRTRSMDGPAAPPSRIARTRRAGTGRCRSTPRRFRTGAHTPLCAGLTCHRFTRSPRY